MAGEDDADTKSSKEDRPSSSLEILDPDPVSTNPPSAAARRKTRTEVYIEELGTAICHCVSTQDWNHWAVGHITEDFEAYIEHADKPFVRNVEEYKEAYNSIAEKWPGYRNELVDINAEVDEKAGTATMWILLRIHHHPTKTMKESVTMSYLRRERGRWLFYKQTGIRGIEMANNSDDFIPVTTKALRDAKLK